MGLLNQAQDGWYIPIYTTSYDIKAFVKEINFEC